MTRADSLSLLTLRGTPRQMGRAHGEALRDAVRENVAIYLKRFLDEGDVRTDEALRRAERYLRVIERNEPDYAELVRGIAEGSGCSLNEIAALNARYEILYSEFSRTEMAAMEAEAIDDRASNRSHASWSDGCTAFVALPDATPDGHLRLGQNWDWIPGVHGVMLDTAGPTGMRVLSFTEAGIAGGKIGVNSAGLGLTINGLVSNLDSWDRLRTPFHVRTWRILNSATIEEGIKALQVEDRSCSANFLLAQVREDGSVTAVDVETAPSSWTRMDVQRGVLAHANHFFDPAALGIWEPVDERSTTRQRCARMQSLLERERGRLDDDRLMALLADHDGEPLSICTHVNPLAPEAETYVTSFSTVMDLTSRSLWAAAGNPCETAFRQYSLG